MAQQCGLAVQEREGGGRGGCIHLEPHGIETAQCWSSQQMTTLAQTTVFLHVFLQEAPTPAHPHLRPLPLQSTCAHGRIQVSETTHALLHEEDWEPTGGVHVKGKVSFPGDVWHSHQAFF